MSTELGILLERWARAKEGDGQVVLLSGEPGIGKSRIARALHERLLAEADTRLVYSCSPFYTSSALYPVLDQLQRAAGFQRDDTADQKLDKLERILGQAPDRHSEGAALLARALSIPAGNRYPPLDLPPPTGKAAHF
jgi:predicted ATPase